MITHKMYRILKIKGPRLFNVFFQHVVSTICAVSPELLFQHFVYKIYIA